MCHIHGCRQVVPTEVKEQGPNYCLAKRLQHWRAVLCRASGCVVSSNVAPATATASVVSNKSFALAYKGPGPVFLLFCFCFISLGVAVLFKVTQKKLCLFLLEGCGRSFSGWTIKYSVFVDCLRVGDTQNWILFCRLVVPFAQTRTDLFLGNGSLQPPVHNHGTIKIHSQMICTCTLCLM